jgi:hypothetical protein
LATEVVSATKPAVAARKSRRLMEGALVAALVSFVGVASFMGLVLFITMPVL